MFLAMSFVVSLYEICRQGLCAKIVVCDDDDDDDDEDDDDDVIVERRMCRF